jgi:hypothetical protein
MMKLKLACIIALTTVIVAPTAVFAKSGYMTCQLHRPTTEHGGSRTYYTYPFKADSASEDAMTAKFQKVSIDSQFLQSTDETIGGCHWEAQRDGAFNVVKGFMKKYPGNEFDFSRALELANK